MAAWATFGSKSEIISVLPPTTVYALAAPTTPPEIHEAVVHRLEAGERVEPAAVKDMIAEARARARMAAQEAKPSAEERKRNVASGRKLPKAKEPEIQILEEGQIAPVLAALDGHWLSPIATVAIGAGMRQGELVALRWSDVDLDGGTVKVARSLEETKATGLRFKEPKSKSGVRTVSLPPSAVDALMAHRKRQLEQRLVLGLGKPGQDALVFCDHEGEAIRPSRVSGAWRDTVNRLKLPRMKFHALRHTHASALIASGVDVVKISKRLGHASPVVTVSIYAHLFKQTDDGAAAAIEAAMRTGAER